MIFQKQRAVFLLAVILVSGCTKPSTTIENSLFDQESAMRSRPFTGSAVDEQFWNKKIKIYQCDNGTFQVFSCGSILGNYETIDRAKESKKEWVEMLLEAERHPSTFTMPNARPCGKEIE